MDLYSREKKRRKPLCKAICRQNVTSQIALPAHAGMIPSSVRTRSYIAIHAFGRAGQAARYIIFTRRFDPLTLLQGACNLLFLLEIVFHFPVSEIVLPAHAGMIPWAIRTRSNIQETRFGVMDLARHTY